MGTKVGGGKHRIALAILGGLALLFVAPLLAWTYQLGSFAEWFRYVTLPAAAILIVAAIIGRPSRLPNLRVALTSGLIGGLLGTIGYDVFRIPFAALGMRLFSPIESYGVLLLDASSSSGWTDLAGWAYHFSNGIALGIFYACVALDRHWGWAILWALILETATVVTPFADAYALRGKWGVITIAYAAHIPYGLGLGYVVSRGTSLSAALKEKFRNPVAATLVLLTLFLLIWHRPFLEDPNDAAGRAIAPGPSAQIVDGRFAPEWIRVTRGCAILFNADKVTYRVITSLSVTDIRGDTTEVICFDGFGVERVPLSIEPYSGGFVIVDR
jgi:hypothetical protein